MGELRIQRGFPDGLRREAAEIYDTGFERQLGLAVRDQEARRNLLAGLFDPSFCFAAFHGNRLVGLAGMHTEEGSLTGGALSDHISLSLLRKHLGLPRALWALYAFNMHTRRPAPDELLMDGIAVAADCRGQGIGSQLLGAIVAHARELGRTTVRLNVTDVNTRARALYERVGFREVSYQSFPYMRWLLGFGGSATMELIVEDSPLP